MTPIIGLIGLPSSGKSTLVNSLAKKRVLQTGLARTTLEPTLIGKTNSLEIANFKKIELISDDDYPYCFLDLPGISDSEDGNRKFDDMTEQHIVKCDLVLWCTNSYTAFLTQHEMLEYQKYNNILKRYEIEHLIPRQMAIVLAKCDTKENADVDIIDDEERDSDSDSDVEELKGGEEETGLKDSIERVKKLFSDTPILQYNAHGRILHTKKQSIELKTLVRKINPGASSSNIEWNMEQFFDTELLERKRCGLEIKGMEKWMEVFTTYCDINIKNNASILCDSCAKITYYDQIKCRVCYARDYYLEYFVPLLDIMISGSNSRLYKAFYDHLFNPDNYKYSWTNYAYLASWIASSLNKDKKNVANFREKTRRILMEKLKSNCKRDVGVERLNIIGARFYNTENIDRGLVYKICLLNYDSHGSVTFNIHEDISPYVYKTLKYTNSIKEGKLCANVTFQYMKFYELDKKLSENILLFARIDFIKEVSNLRKEIWGDSEKNIDINNIFYMAINGIIPSLFWYIPDN